MSVFGDIYEFFMRRWYRERGYSDYYIFFLRREWKNAFKNTGLPKEEVEWAKKRGFFPWHIRQYGLTEENYRGIISDKDYYYLHPLNNQYKKWIDDKLTMKYVLAPFDRFLPRYYYHLMKGRDVMRLMDCPEGYEGSAEDIVRLLEEKKLLAAKKATGVYGIGFYKLAFEDGKYFANEKEYGREDLLAFLAGLDDYIVTEFVEMHPDLKKINPTSVNTVRVVVLNEHGNDPEFAYTFMRIGTKRSGSVDNVAQGGMVVRVDMDTGRYYGAESLSNHVYHAEKTHPDTGEPLEGTLPNWEIVKQGILDIARYCPQLKWIGYDIAITQDGFSIIEINSHPGLHKAHEFSEEVQSFLFRELQKKKDRTARGE